MATYSDFEALPPEAACHAVANLMGIGRDKIKRVLNTKFRAGSKVGDGMTSVVKVVDIEYECTEEGSKEEEAAVKSASMMGKFSVVDKSGGGVSVWWEEMHLFQREMEFYEKLMPRFKTVYQRESPRSKPLRHIR